MNALECFIVLHDLNPANTMNYLMNQGLISDLATTPDAVSAGDAERARDHLAEMQGEN